jgi:hypothetical protein
MKAKFLAFVLGAILLAGCEDRTFEYVATVSQSLDYTIDQEGAFDETYTVYANSFNDELDLPDDAIIGDVFIEALSVGVKELSGNEASAVKLTGSAGGTNFVEDLVVDVATGTYEFTVMAGLIEEGIRRMRNDLMGIVESGNPPSIVFRLQGDSDPVTGQRLNVDVRIDVTVTVLYALETEFPAL